MSGGGKKRRDLRQGQQQFNQFADKAIGTLQPYAQGGLPAFNNANALLGLSGEGAQDAARAQFEASPFYQGGAFDYERANRELKAGFGADGNLFSTAFANADRRAARDTYSNAFQQFLGLNQSQSGIGANTAGAIAQTQLGQGQAALGTAQNIANTRQGFLGGLGQVAGIGRTIAGGFGGFG